MRPGKKISCLSTGCEEQEAVQQVEIFEGTPIFLITILRETITCCEMPIPERFWYLSISGSNATSSSTFFLIKKWSKKSRLRKND
jgi:hypothetical protein